MSPSGPRASDDHEVQHRVRRQQPRQTLNHAMEALALDQRAHRDKHFRICRQAELPSRVQTRDWGELRQIDAVADHLHRAGLAPCSMASACKAPIP